MSLFPETLPFVTKNASKRLKSSHEWLTQPDNVNKDVPQGVYQDYIEAVKKDVCCWCNNKGGTKDHIEPQCFGGNNHWSNITGACERCNGKRGHVSIVEWMMCRRNGRGTFSKLKSNTAIGELA